MLTKEEAIQAMQKGKKVTHKYFNEDEYIFIEGEFFVGDDGIKLNEKEFWLSHRGYEWLTDWELYTK